MWLKFSKMHGLGNDFMVVDLITQNGHIHADKIPALAHRHTGVGFDQLLLVEKPTQPEVDFRYRIFNADGSEVENCGNGARCFARFVFDQHLTGKRQIRVETATGIMELKLTDDKDVVVDMGKPILTPAQIPFNAEQFAAQYSIEVDGIGAVNLGAVSMGNPHAVIRVDDIDQAPVAHWGSLIEPHTAFPNKVNVGFMQVINEHEVRLRVFERGVGETLACGTGACAAVVSGQLRGWLKPGVKVSLPGGDLWIEWDGDQGHVHMTGPATPVFEGRMNV
ncbi:diaminopimelate epimerase [Bacterioplanes sanyensis]|jgi:diaminopimelate epimerase|uniref:diaminopimelate epimerase n=1 Tax=Bacterioplanes sanyensis TaxID=1249553 RepID=UPI00167AAD2A|nr:diaminopimelate epimerase [Bacterioplanes sanyensis]GGY53152.1 diaminopimelate epimerase [Bacterioplanes sanyensis]